MAPGSSCNNPSSPSFSLGITMPLLFADSSMINLATNSSSNSSPSLHLNASSPSPSVVLPPVSSSFPTSSLTTTTSKGGPAFVGQVFSMCDPSGTGLMAVTNHLQLPFLSKRTPEWIRKLLSKVTRTDSNGPVFRFFMDLSDAVAYVKRLNISSGMVGACRLDVAYEHFKEKPHMFQFVPNEKQIKAANKLLRTVRHKPGNRKINGVPVFTAENLNIAIATTDGIKWYTPYFFDKSMLDNILETSTDQHFHTMIQNRLIHRRRDVIDDNIGSEAIEDSMENLFEPPEVQDILEEMGHSELPFSVISKAAEIQMFDVVDKVLLGNKWLRKATGIQPKFPYLVDTFEERSAASFRKSSESGVSKINSEENSIGEPEWQLGGTEFDLNKKSQGNQFHEANYWGFHLPFEQWFSNFWSKLPVTHQTPNHLINSRTRLLESEDGEVQVPTNPLLPKITMIGISTSEGGQMSKGSLKKTMEDLTKELEKAQQRNNQMNEVKDPLFVANVGDYSSITKTRTI